MDSRLPPWTPIGPGVSARRIPAALLYFDPTPLPDILGDEDAPAVAPPADPSPRPAVPRNIR